MNADTLHPSTMLLSKLASILVRVDELPSSDKYSVNLVALFTTLRDPEVQQWIKEMTAMALAPMKRN